MLSCVAADKPERHGSAAASKIDEYKKTTDVGRFVFNSAPPSQSNSAHTNINI